MIANHWKVESSRSPSSESSLPTDDISVRIDNFASNLLLGSLHTIYCQRNLKYNKGMEFSKLHAFDIRRYTNNLLDNYPSAVYNVDAFR